MLSERPEDAIFIFASRAPGRLLAGCPAGSIQMH